jgi:hypothetical protein
MQERNLRIWIAWGVGALVILWVVSSLFSGWNHGGAWGMMNPGMMGNWHRGDLGGHMGGRMGGGWGFGPLGLLFGLMGLMFRLGLFALLVLGGFWLFNRLGGTQGLSAMLSSGSPSGSPSGMAHATRTCANCGQPVQSHWQHCPHCGQPLAHAKDEGDGPEGTPPTETVHA